MVQKPKQLRGMMQMEVVKRRRYTSKEAANNQSAYYGIQEVVL